MQKVLIQKKTIQDVINAHAKIPCVVKNGLKTYIKNNGNGIDVMTWSSWQDITEITHIDLNAYIDNEFSVLPMDTQEFKKLLNMETKGENITLTPDSIIWENGLKKILPLEDSLENDAIKIYRSMYSNQSKSLIGEIRPNFSGINRVYASIWHNKLGVLSKLAEKTPDFFPVQIAKKGSLGVIYAGTQDRFAEMKLGIINFNGKGEFSGYISAKQFKFLVSQMAPKGDNFYDFSFYSEDAKNINADKLIITANNNRIMIKPREYEFDLTLFHGKKQDDGDIFRLPEIPAGEIILFTKGEGQFITAKTDYNELISMKITNYDVEKPSEPVNFAMPIQDLKILLGNKALNKKYNMEIELEKAKILPGNNEGYFISYAGITLISGGMNLDGIDSFKNEESPSIETSKEEEEMAKKSMAKAVEEHIKNTSEAGKALIESGHLVIGGVELPKEPIYKEPSYEDFCNASINGTDDFAEEETGIDDDALEEEPESDLELEKALTKKALKLIPICAKTGESLMNRDKGPEIGAKDIAVLYFHREAESYTAKIEGQKYLFHFDLNGEYIDEIYCAEI